MMLRSLLFVPADSQRKLAKARETEADALVLDWEDSVGDGEKAAARRRTVEALGAGSPRGQVMLVRVNRAGSDAFREDCQALSERLQPMTADVSAELNALIRAGKRLLFEGAQAALLDIDHGTYPFVTSSNCVAGQASAGSGVGPQQLHYVLGVAKAYATRVGSGPFPTELDDEVGDRLRVRGNEYGSVTGRPRRCGWFDAAGLRRVVEINGITGLCITKLDVLDGLDTVRIAIGYKVRGEQRDILPVGADALSICAPVYEELPGWQESTEGVQSFEDLPKNAQAYLRRLEVLVGAPIAIISTGPERLETIVLRHPFD